MHSHTDLTNNRTTKYLHNFTIGFALSSVLVSCISQSPGWGDENSSVTAAPLVSEATHLGQRQPDWVTRLPVEPGVLYFVGESSAQEKELAMERAWYTALVRVGTTEFPELTQLKTQSTETLEKSSYERRAVAHLQYIDWTGVKEVKEKGSPFVIAGSEKGTFVAFRLLKWSQKDIERSRKKVTTSLAIKSSSPSYIIPSSPESQLDAQENTVQELVKVNFLNRKIAERNLKLEMVMKKLKCGTTISDLEAILGHADQVQDYSYDGEVGRKRFYWGAYQVTVTDAEHAVDWVRSNMGNGPKKAICGH